MILKNEYLDDQNEIITNITSITYDINSNLMIKSKEGTPNGIYIVQLNSFNEYFMKSIDLKIYAGTSVKFYNK